MKLDDLLLPEAEKYDVPLDEPYDLGNDDDLLGAISRSSADRRALFRQLLKTERPRSRRAVEGMYSRIERQYGHIPYEDGLADDGSVVANTFARLVAGPDLMESAVPQTARTFGRTNDNGPPAPRVSEGSRTALDKLFENPKFAPIPITKDTYGPLARSARPGFPALSKFGWNAPITDPFGDVMRNALRRLVRAA